MTAVDRAHAYTVPQVAERLNKGVRATYAAIERGEIPAIRVGRNVRVPAHALDALLGAAGDGVAAGAVDAAAIEQAVERGVLNALRTILREGVGGGAP